MHGIRRQHPSLLTDEERAEKAAKIQRYKQIKEAAMSMRSRGVRDQRALEIVAKLLEVNPEFYTLWNYRREILQTLMHDAASADECAKRIVQDELHIVERAIRRNPKSYVAWYHRLWVVRLGYANLDAEIQLTADFLRLDARNFHCWDYRRALVAMDGVEPHDELHFTSTKIAQDFSNYSACKTRFDRVPKIVIYANKSFSRHYRSKLLLQIGLDDERLDAELDLVTDAVYTEPDDQSAWLYHNWLCFHQRQPPPDRLRRQLAMIAELLDLEPNCKWAILTKVRLMSALQEKIGDDEHVSSHRRLVELDGQRRRYYDALFQSLVS